MKVTMKKTVAWIIGLAMISGMIIYFPLVAKAATSGDYEYVVLDDGSAEITDYKGSDSVVEVPAEIAGHQVKSIGRYAFSENSNLTSIKIPESVTNIEGYAFQNCVKLSSIELPKNLTSIEDSTFASCTSLTSIELPDGLMSIGYSAFRNCAKLSNIELPEGLMSIEMGAFSACIRLTSIELPEGLMSVEGHAFSNCKRLTNIEIPKGVTSIGDSAFYGCDSLTNIELPEGVTSIGTTAFYHTGLTSITIPEGVTVIREEMFDSCESLMSIELPEGLMSIEDRAFNNCESLTSIEIPKGVTSIGIQAFNNTGLKDVYYQGTKEDRAKIEVDIGNKNLLSATWHYDSKTEPNPNPSDEHTHTLVKTEAVAATCETDGNIAYWTCSGCKKIFSDAAGTKEVTKEATVQKALGHNWGEWKTIKEATTVEEGLEERVCSRDASHKQPRSIPKQNNPDQNKKEGWHFENNGWFYYKNNTLQKGWILDGAWYYLNPTTGIMMTGWQKINNVWYYLKTDGAMAANEWCEGYWLNGDGSWTYPYYGQWHLDSVGWWFGDNSGWYARNGISRISGVDYQFNASGYWVH